LQNKNLNFSRPDILETLKKAKEDNKDLVNTLIETDEKVFEEVASIEFDKSPLSDEKALKIYKDGIKDLITDNVSKFLKERKYNEAIEILEEINLKNDIKPITAKELMEAEFPPPSWIVPDLIPQGLSIMAGKPKIGKSWLAYM